VKSAGCAQGDEKNWLVPARPYVYEIACTTTIGSLGSGEARDGGAARGTGRERGEWGGGEGGVEDRWKFDSGRKGRINGAGGTHRGHKSPARPGITGSQLAKYDGLINPSPLARAPPSTTSGLYVPRALSRLPVPPRSPSSSRSRALTRRGARGWRIREVRSPARIYVSARRATAIYNLRAWKSEVHNLIRSFRSAWRRWERS